VDEAGRGALAGPVVAACVIFPKNLKKIKGIDDSKKLSPERRARLYSQIKARAEAFSIALVGHQRIDTVNIRNASFEAMKKAIRRLKLQPELVLVDGFEIPDLGIAQKGIIKGDQKSYSIAAASILAKVTRDRIMGFFHERYPLFNFNKHKGYPTAEHLAKLKKFGSCPIHRRSYRPVREVINHAKQTFSIDAD
jgi:ribonuclease HII